MASHSARQPRQAQRPAGGSSSASRPLAVDAELDALDLGPARPGAALDGGAAGGERPLALGEAGEAGRDHQRARRHARERRAGVVLVPAEPVRVDLLVPLERPVDDGDPVKPLHARHPVPARHDEAKREAVLGEERPAVHPVGEEDVVAGRLLEREAARVVLLLAAFDAAVEPGEDDLDCAVERPGLGEQRRERRARPRGGAERLGEPGLARRAGERGGGRARFRRTPSSPRARPAAARAGRRASG